MQSKWIVVLLTVLTVLVVVILVSSFIGMGSTGAVGTAAEPDTITVYGQGKVTASPDIVYITLGFENIDMDPKKALDDNAAQMERILAAVRAAGVGDASIQTARYSIDPDYSYPGDEKVLEGYRVVNTARITMEQVGAAGDIIKAASDAGANVMDGIRFDLRERQGVYIEALDIAAERAHQKAAQLASDAGRGVGAVVGIEESGVSYSYYSALSNYVSSDSGGSLADYASGAVSLGELEITAVIYITYRLNG